MNLSKLKRVFRKARRNMFGQAPDMRACTSIVTVTSRPSTGNVIQPTRELYGQISFYLGSRPISIHGQMSLNTGGKLDTHHHDYSSKLAHLENILVQGVIHLQSKDKRSLKIREFLNHEDDDNAYGSSVMLHIPPIEDTHEYCTFEIASCHFKMRQNPDRKELLIQLRFMLKSIRQHKVDFEEGYLVWKSRNL